MLGNIPEADFCYQQAVAFDARAVQSHFGIVRIRLSRRQHAAALSHLGIIRNLVDGSTLAEWHYLSGIAHHLAQHLRESLERFQKAAELGHPAARNSIVKLFQHGLPPANAQLINDKALVAEIANAIPNQKQRWRFAQSLWAGSGHTVRWYELMAATFLQKHEFAYAARTLRAYEAAGDKAEVSTCPALAEIDRWHAEPTQ